MNLNFLQKINQKLKSLDINSDSRKMSDVFNQDEILELRKYENIAIDYYKSGFNFTFEDYINFRKHWQDFNDNVAHDRKKHDNNQKLKQFLNSKEKLKIIHTRENGKKNEMPKPEKFKGIETEIIYIDEK